MRGGQATEALREFNADAATQRALQEAFNITSPCLDVRTGADQNVSGDGGRRMKRPLREGVP
jgi:hypothetical protein